MRVLRAGWRSTWRVVRGQSCAHHPHPTPPPAPAPSAGRRIALVVRGSMPGVQTMHVFDSTTRQLRLLCRCVKARLLPSTVWLFPPR